jgi:hypothetical protein
MKLTVREKVLLTILLAVIASWLFGCTHRAPALSGNLTDVAYLHQLYDGGNEQYFQGQLPEASIDMDEPDESGNMASTYCNDLGTVCNIHFNLRYVGARRVAELVMLHEQCHVKTWMKDMDTMGRQVEHGRRWRACMLGLDAEGGFREILIDGFQETQK